MSSGELSGAMRTQGHGGSSPFAQGLSAALSDLTVDRIAAWAERMPVSREAPLPAPSATARTTKVAEKAIVSSLLPLEVAKCTGLPLSTCSLIALYSEVPQGLAKYQALLAENVSKEPREFIIPPRRICGCGGYESNATWEMIENTTFITSAEIVQVHAMKFLRNSPFAEQLSGMKLSFYEELEDDHPLWISSNEGLITRLHAVAITATGKHVILQQAGKSCVPSSVAMLILDHGKTPDYRAIKETSLANDQRAMQWVEKAGLKPKMTVIGGDGTRDLLIKCLAEHGPGVLGISHPVIGGHVLVLDEISTKTNTAKIREPFHGWSITIKLDALLSWVGERDSFIQIVS